MLQTAPRRKKSTASRAAPHERFLEAFRWMLLTRTLEDKLVSHAAPILTRYSPDSYSREAGIEPAPLEQRSATSSYFSAAGTFSVPAMIFAL